MIPDLPDVVSPDRLHLGAGLDFSAYDTALAGSPHRWELPVWALEANTDASLLSTRILGQNTRNPYTFSSM